MNRKEERYTTMRRMLLLVSFVLAGGCGAPTADVPDPSKPSPSREKQEAPSPVPRKSANLEVAQDAFNDVGQAIEVLKSPADDKAAYSAYTWLGMQGETAVPALVAGIREETTGAQTKVYMCRALGGAGPPSTDALIAILQDDARPVRLAAIKELGRLRPTSDQILTTLIKLIEHEDVQMRYHAIEALSKIGPPAKAMAFDVLMATRTDDRQPAAIRTAAGEALKAVAPRRTFNDG